MIVILLSELAKFVNGLSQLFYHSRKGIHTLKGFRVMEKLPELVGRYTFVLGMAKWTLQQIREAVRAQEREIICAAVYRMVDLVGELQQLTMEVRLTPGSDNKIADPVWENRHTDFLWPMLNERAIRKWFIPIFIDMSVEKQEVILAFCNYYAEELRRAVRIHPQGKRCLVAYAFFDATDWADIYVGQLIAAQDNAG